jgi:hypothetical protein
VDLQTYHADLVDLNRNSNRILTFGSCRFSSIETMFQRKVSEAIHCDGRDALLLLLLF